MGDRQRHQFSEEYSDYWKNISRKPPSETGIPDSEMARTTLEKILEGYPARFTSALDVACGSGRLHGVLSKMSAFVDGVEVEDSAAASALQSGYRQVFVTPVEKFSPETKYDFVLCWAAFEVLDQQRALEVFSEAVGESGFIVLTAKSANYLPDDSGALEAEAAAAAKNFMQSFIDPPLFADALSEFGFEVLRTLTFAKRGDLARGAFETLEHGIPSSRFYEFAILLHKIGPGKPNRHSRLLWSLPRSATYELVLGRRDNPN